MKGLEINYETVQEGIRDMRLIRNRYPAVGRVSASGGGKGVAEMEQLADLYVSFYGALERLIEETEEYLINMLTDFRNADESKTVTAGEDHR